MTRRPTTRQSIRSRRAASRAGRAFARLVRIMQTLRAPHGCPWDRKQTPETLRPFLLEETYEALDAIDHGDANELKGELGDVLFQCVFQSQIAAERGQFEIADAVDAIVRKLVRRHPHVFRADGRPLGRAQKRAAHAKTPAVVLQQWERLKANEQAEAGVKKRVLSGVPRSLPALLRAHEIGTRVAAIGFDWAHAPDVVSKIEEEVRELREALTENPRRAAEEMGDLLFSLANLARKLGLEPEAALRGASDKFTHRFDAVEALLEARGRSVHDATLPELEEAWVAAKKGLTAQSHQPTTGVPSASRRARSRGQSPARRRRRDRS